VTVRSIVSVVGVEDVDDGDGVDGDVDVKVATLDGDVVERRRNRKLAEARHVIMVA
jgi:hypothetical protein